MKLHFSRRQLPVYLRIGAGIAACSLLLGGCVDRKAANAYEAMYAANMPAALFADGTGFSYTVTEHRAEKEVVFKEYQDAEVRMEEADGVTWIYTADQGFLYHDKELMPVFDPDGIYGSELLKTTALLRNRHDDETPQAFVDENGETNLTTVYNDLQNAFVGYRDRVKPKSVNYVYTLSAESRIQGASVILNYSDGTAYTAQTVTDCQYAATRPAIVTKALELTASNQKLGAGETRKVVYHIDGKVETFTVKKNTSVVFHPSVNSYTLYTDAEKTNVYESGADLYEDLELWCEKDF